MPTILLQCSVVLKLSKGQIRGQYTHYNPSCKQATTEGPYLYDPRSDNNKLGGLKKIA